MTRYPLIAALVAALALAAAPAAMAGTQADVEVAGTTDVYTGETATATQTIDSRLSCTAPVLSSSLALLGDTRSYFPAPGADFESYTLAGWQLSGGASPVAGNEPSHVLGLLDRTSLRLVPGSSATSPSFCIDLNYPTFRFFVAQLRDAAPDLEVDVIYPDIAGKNVRMAATVKGGKASDWTLAKDVPLRPKTADKSAGWRRVALRFRVPAGASGDWRIDDVVVDPACRY